MDISTEKLQNTIHNIKEGLLYLKQGDKINATSRINNALLILENKMRCPKCNSVNVLVGTNDDPNKCSNCKHKWKGTAKKIGEQLLAIKDPDKLFTINQTITRKNHFTRQLERKLENI